MPNKPREFNGDFCKETCRYFAKTQWPCCLRYNSLGKELCIYDLDIHRRVVRLNGVIFSHETEFRWWRCARCIEDKET
jgi:hypothetical protein